MEKLKLYVILSLTFLLSAQLCFAANLSDGLITYMPFDTTFSAYDPTFIENKGSSNFTFRYVLDGGSSSDLNDSDFRSGTDCRTINDISGCIELNHAEHDWMGITQTINPSSFFPTDSFSISMGVRSTDNETESAFFRFADNLPVVQLKHETNGSTEFFVRDASVNSDIVSVGKDWNGAGTVFDDEWHMLTVTYDDSNNAMRLYRDGVLVAETTFDSNAGAVFGNDCDRFDGGCLVGHFRFVNDPPKDALNPSQLEGFIDEVRIYNRSLSAGEVEELYNTTFREEDQPLTLEDDLIVYLPMADGDNYTSNGNVENAGEPAVIWEATNFGPHDYNGTTGLLVNGSFGEYRYSGSGTPIARALQSTNLRSFMPSNNVTIASFFKADGQVTTKFQKIFSIRGGDAKLQLSKMPNGSLRFSIRDDASTTELLPELSSLLLDGHYHHFAATIKELGGNSHELKLYVDGDLVETFTPSFTSSIITDSCVTGPGERCEISGEVATFNEPFDGSIDEFRLYARTLNATEIAQLANIFTPVEQCRDNVDNDNDTFTDFPNDNGCDDYLDDDEFVPTTLSCDAVVEWWSFDNGSLFGKKNGWVLTNNGAVATTGKIGDGYQFTRSESDFLNAGDRDEFSFGTSPFSITAWAQYDSIGSDPAIVSKNGIFEYSFYSTLDAAIRTYVTTNGGANRLGVSASNAVVVSGFEFYGSTYEGGLGPLANRLWRNETELTRNDDKAGTYTGMVNTNNPLTIGGTFDQGQYFDGKLDEVVLWNTELTQDNFTILYNNGAGISYEELCGPGFTLLEVSLNVEPLLATSLLNVSASGNVTLNGVLVTNQIVDISVNGSLNTTVLTDANGEFNTTFLAPRSTPETRPLPPSFPDPVPINVTATVTLGNDTAEDSELLQYTRVPPVAVITESFEVRRVELGETEIVIVFASPGNFVQLNGSESFDQDNGFIEEYKWFLDDVDATLFGAEQLYQFNVAGNFDNSFLQVTDNDGFVGIEPFLIRVASGLFAPVAFPIFDEVGRVDDAFTNAGESIKFDGNASADFDGFITDYEWRFETTNLNYQAGNSLVITRNNAIVNETLPCGDFNVTLTVTDNSSQTDANSEIFNTTGIKYSSFKSCSPPSASFTTNVSAYAPANPRRGQEIAFDASASIASLDPRGIDSLVSYEWDFGDGSNASGITAVHSYSECSPTGHIVTLTVTDGETLTSSTTTNIVVCNNPTAELSAAPTSIEPAQAVLFNASLSSKVGGSIVSYNYSFGNGDSLDTTSAEIFYSGYTECKPEGYMATVEVVDDEGFTALSAPVTIFVCDPPIADLVASPTLTRRNMSVLFNASESVDSGSIVNYTYDFKDGTIITTAASEITHSYEQCNVAGYNAQVTVTDDTGLTDSANALVRVCDLPTATFTASLTNPEAFQNVTFDASASSPGAIGNLTYIWDFGDTNALLGEVVTHHYTSCDNFTVKLRVIDDENLEDETTRVLNVCNEPVAVLKPKNDTLVDFWTPQSGVPFTHAVQFSGLKIKKGDSVAFFGDESFDIIPIGSPDSTPDGQDFENLTYEWKLNGVVVGNESTLPSTLFDECGAVSGPPIFNEYYRTNHGLLPGTSIKRVSIEVFDHMHDDIVDLTVTDSFRGSTPYQSLSDTNSVKVRKCYPPVAIADSNASYDPFSDTHLLEINQSVLLDARESFDLSLAPLGREPTGLALDRFVNPGGNAHNLSVITNYLWEVWDGSIISTTADTAVLSFSECTYPEKRRINLTVTDDEDQFTTDFLDVIVCSPPIMSLEAVPTNTEKNMLVIFNASDSYDPNDGTIVSYNFTFEDGTSIISSTPVVNRTFTECNLAGEQVSVIGTDDDDLLSQPAVVSVQVCNRPTPVIDAPLQSERFVPATFNASQSFDVNFESLPDNGITSFLWEIDYDGTLYNSTDKVFDFTFSEGCDFDVDVTLHVNDSDNLFSSTDHTLQVCQAPIADASPEVQGAPVDTAIAFDGSASFDPGFTDTFTRNITFYRWDFGDGTIAEGDDLVNPTHSYVGNNRVVEVVLTVFDADNLTDTDSVFVSVINASGFPNGTNPILPIALVEPDVVIANVGEQVQFDGSNSFGPNLTYEWDFNVANQNPQNITVDAVGPVVNTTYLTEGPRLAFLRVFNQFGEDVDSSFVFILASANDSVPVINSVMDAPDPVNTTQEISFFVDWDDLDTADGTVYVCDSENISAAFGCENRTYCSVTGTQGMVQCQFTPDEQDVNTHEYYVAACNSQCSTIEGPFSFTVQQEIACGVVLTQDTTLESDLNCLGSDGLILGADDITLDCAGHTLTGNNSPGTRGISVIKQKNVDVINCTMENFDDGLFLKKAKLSTFIDNTMIGSDRGIAMKEKNTDNVIQGNAISGSRLGIRVEGRRNTLHDNVVVNSTNRGIVLKTETRKNVLTENFVCTSGIVDIKDKGPTQGQKQNTGDDNTCDSVNSWDDDGTTGCTFTCP